jgi:hypothetical protein
MYVLFWYTALDVTDIRIRTVDLDLHFPHAYIASWLIKHIVSSVSIWHCPLVTDHCVTC